MRYPPGWCYNFVFQVLNIKTFTCFCSGWIACIYRKQIRVLGSMYFLWICHHFLYIGLQSFAIFLFLLPWTPDFTAWDIYTVCQILCNFSFWRVSWATNVGYRQFVSRLHEAQLSLIICSIFCHLCCSILSYSCMYRYCCHLLWTIYLNYTNIQLHLA